MYRRIGTFMTLLGLLAIFSQCKLVDFGGEAVFVTVSFDQTYTINSTETSFDETSSFNVAEAYEDAGVDPAEVASVDLVDVIIDVLENSTGSDVTISGSLRYRILPMPEYTLASFTDQNLNQLLENDLSPLSSEYPLSLNADALTSLKLKLGEVPPPTILFRFTGTSSGSPINFRVRVRVQFQVGVVPS